MPTFTADGAEIEVPADASLSQVEVWPIQGLIRHFRPEVERRIGEHGAGFAEAAA